MGRQGWRRGCWVFPAWVKASLRPQPIPPDPSFAVLHGLYWLCANLTVQHPLALVVDDAHWADGASLRFLAFLLPRLEELHAAVLLGARPAEAGERRELLAALTMDPATEVVTVGPLSAKGVATLVAVALGVEPEPGFVTACLGGDRRYALSGPHSWSKLCERSRSRRSPRRQAKYRTSRLLP